jgi:hypothetical protein
VGAGVVRDLRMKLGRMTVKKKAPVKAAPVITEEQRKMIDAWGQEIASPELREALVRAAARSLEAKRTRKTVPYEGPPGPSYAGPEIIAPPPPPDPVDRWAIDRDRWRDREKK